MKQFLMTALLAGSLAAFTGCKDDDDGKPLTAPEAAVLYVILRFGEDGALLSVRQAIRPWGTVDDHIEF